MKSQQPTRTFMLLFLVLLLIFIAGVVPIVIISLIESNIITLPLPQSGLTATIFDYRAYPPVMTALSMTETQSMGHWLQTQTAAAPTPEVSLTPQ